MKFKEVLLKELVKKGYEVKENKKVWNLANRSLLYMTPELAKSFLKLNEHPKYKKTVIEIEMDLIKKHAKEFVRCMNNDSYNLIDMGCGNGNKAKIFLEALEGKGKIRYCAVSPSEFLANIALENIKKANFKNVAEYKSYITNLDLLEEISSMVRTSEFKRNVILLFGSILASFEIHEYLFNLSRAMFKEDCLIIGNGIRVGERLVNLDTYTHPLIVEWLNHLIRELGFKQDDGLLGIRFANSRIEGFYKINKDKKINCGEREIEFKRNDEILITVLYKYYESELKEFCSRYFCETSLVKDSDNEYALVFYKK